MKKTGKILLLIVLAAMTAAMSGCCGRGAKQVPGQKGSAVSPAAGKKDPAKSGAKTDLVERPLDILEKTGLNYSLDNRGKMPDSVKKSTSAFFETQYLEGIQLMEKGDFTKAVTVFEGIAQRYPNSEEASVAELCIAELYFRSKSNNLALQAYKQIVEKYPDSHAAENARAGIRYLEDFEKYEQEHIPSDVEDRKRRGR